MTTIRQDLGYALRTLRKSPGFAAVAIGTLALGIGANAAIFSVVHAVPLKPLPFARSGELVRVTSDLTRRGARASSARLPWRSSLPERVTSSRID